MYSNCEKSFIEALLLYEKMYENRHGELIETQINNINFNNNYKNVNNPEELVKNDNIILNEDLLLNDKIKLPKINNNQFISPDVQTGIFNNISAPSQEISNVSVKTNNAPSQSQENMTNSVEAVSMLPSIAPAPSLPSLKQNITNSVETSPAMPPPATTPPLPPSQQNITNSVETSAMIPPPVSAPTIPALSPVPPVTKETTEPAPQET